MNNYTAKSIIAVILVQDLVDMTHANNFLNQLDISTVNVMTLFFDREVAQALAVLQLAVLVVGI